MHPGQLTITTPTVRALVAGHPAWAGLGVTAMRTPGTVNAVFRLGDELAARFLLEPLDPAEAARLLDREATAAGELAAQTRFPVPRPVGRGEPGHGYPLPWSVQTWLPGVTALDVMDRDGDPAASTAFAVDLAAFVADARSADTQGRTFAGLRRTGRGGDLRAHDDWVQDCLARSVGLVDVDRLRRCWADLRELPRVEPDVMTHGDLTPANVLVERGRLAGVLDCGGYGPADPALDLVGAWHLLDVERRRVFRAALGCGDLSWARGRAWAFEQALGLVEYYARTNPAMSRMGRRTLDHILADPPGPPARAGERDDAAAVPPVGFEPTL